MARRAYFLCLSPAGLATQDLAKDNCGSGVRLGDCNSTVPSRFMVADTDAGRHGDPGRITVSTMDHYLPRRQSFLAPQMAFGGVAYIRTFGIRTGLSAINKATLLL